MSVNVGQPAPDFSLYDEAKNKTTLSSLKGSNVLLLFFPQAFTSVCTKELCGVRDNIAMYNKANAKVFGISVDSVYTLAQFKEAQHYNFPLLSDFNKDVIRKYDVVNPDMIGLKNIARRAVFVIDKSGVVRYREVLDDARNEPDYKKLNEALSTIGQ